MFNGIDQDMFKSVKPCSTPKEAWDTIQIMCEGSEKVRENKMQLLIWPYEHFHSISGEILSDTLIRF